VRLVLATRNEHKRREFARLLGGHTIESLADAVQLPPEDGETFADNASAKAWAAARATGRLTFADDSGIEAAALGGAPGVSSARYAGLTANDEQNLAKLLAHAPPGSGLTYVCALSLVDPASGQEQLFEARCSGTVAARPAGTGGFGYDPAFVPDDLTDGRTMSELTDAEKDAISHRGRAARQLAAWLEQSSPGGSAQVDSR
jgi:XTP/dITP diphosphohydrolase